MRNLAGMRSIDGSTYLLAGASYGLDTSTFGTL